MYIHTNKHKTHTHTHCSANLPPHLMTRNRNEKQIRPIRIVRGEATLPNILEKIALTRVFPRQFPRRLIKRRRIAVPVNINPKLHLHFGVIQLENLRRMVDIRKRGRIGRSIRIGIGRYDELA